MNILCIGGSNLVIKNGISNLLPEILKSEIQHESITVDNIAIPGTGSMMGLHTLLDSPKQAYSYVIIEYGINDYPLYAQNPNLWRHSFSELLKLVNKNNPSASILTLVLGRRDTKFFEKQSLMHQEMIALSREWGCKILDIDSHLKSENFNKVDFRELYSDGNHYASPLVTRYISSLAANAILGDLVKKQAGFNATRCLSTKETVQNFHGYDLQALSAQLRQTNFSNSKFSRRAFTLTNEQRLEFVTEGTPCGISFISTKNSGSILLEVDGQKVIINTLHSRVASGEFDFLVRYTPFFWLGRNKVSRTIKENRKVTLSIVQPNDSEWNPDLIKPSFQMIENGYTAETEIHLSGLTLCSKY